MPSIKELRTLWALARVKIALLSMATLWTCWATAMNGVNVSTMTFWDWFMLVGGCLASWSLNMISFIDKSAAQVAAGNIPGLDVNIDDEETTHLTKPSEPKP